MFITKAALAGLDGKKPIGERMKKLIVGLLASLIFTSVFAGGMGSLHLAISEAVATEFVSSDSHEEFYFLADNMVITGQSTAPNCDIVYEGKTSTIQGETIIFDACINIVSRSEFIIAISENEAP